ncbi:MAG: cytochrome c4 [Gammaproteobacteria bacterium]|nr:cytochrome c4 [Gammaproteobacteria bacterium]MBU1969197.1 cytochrome c4 [Gammaproteobacteria bacterium]
MKHNYKSIGRCLRTLGVLIGMMFMPMTSAWAEDAPAPATEAAAPATEAAPAPEVAAAPAGPQPLEERLQLCAGCHNPDGNSIIPENPKLSGLDAKYLLRQLKDFKSGDRTNDIMSGIIGMVDESEFKDLAAYFNEQKRSEGVTEKPELAAQGKQIFDEGIIGSAVPACSGCHNEDGSGTNKYPRLNGQNPVYVANQLKNFKSGARKNDPKAVMQTVAKRMNDAEIEAVAEYIVTLKEAQ